MVTKSEVNSELNLILSKLEVVKNEIDCLEIDDDDAIDKYKDKLDETIKSVISLKIDLDPYGKNK